MVERSKIYVEYKNNTKQLGVELVLIFSTKPTRKYLAINQKQYNFLTILFSFLIYKKVVLRLHLRIKTVSRRFFSSSSIE